MADRTLSTFATGIAPVAALVLLLLASLTLMSEATQGSARFGELFSVLLVVNVLGLLSLAALIGWNLYHLIGQVRAGRPGARLTLRMVALFVVLAVTPVMVVFYFSMQFLHRGIDSWFDVRIERALEDALELGRTALGVKMRESLKQSELVANELAGVEGQGLSLRLDDARRLSGAAELTLTGAKGRILAFSARDPTAIVPDTPTDTVLAQLRRGGSYISLDPIGERGLHVRVVLALPEDIPTAEPRILVALYPMTERMSRLADGVENAYGKYRELAYLRSPLKTSFTLTLSLVLLLGMLTAVWAAFLSARRVVAPLRDLAEGTRAVAEGDFETQLPGTGKDEVGFLVESFNEMTRRLAQARDETRTSQQQVEAQRTYLEAVLARLSAGVLTLDADLRVHTANGAAAQILGMDRDEARECTLEELVAVSPHLEPLVTALTERLRPRDRPAAADWRGEVRILGPVGRKILMCSGTALAGTGEAFAGHVVVIDDITALVDAQRSAAWSEVARRLAHEIKNPLTPIRLSAERLRHKYLDTMSADAAAPLDRLTRTIVTQVDAMQKMVNAFSDYARMPRMQAAPVDLNALVTDVLEMYRDDGSEIRIEVDLDPALPLVEVDGDRIRQVIHNLVKNAREAGGETSPGGVRVSTRALGERGDRFVELRVRDRGPGFPPEMLDRIFEPYVTSKPKGTGLGLAIVRKIAEEHAGAAWAENIDDGACIVVRLPLPAPDAVRTAVEVGGQVA